MTYSRVKDVLVWLPLIRSGAPPEVPVADVLYDFDRCSLSPRAQAAPFGVSVVIKNSDPHLHFVRARGVAGTTLFTSTLAPGELRKFAAAGAGLARISCDLHPWESAWVFLKRNPYAIVTKADGAFLMKNVPPGTYMLRAWHAGWQRGKHATLGYALEPRPIEVEDSVVVTAGRVTDVTLSLWSGVIDDHDVLEGLEL